jgi:hypothetical protein
MRSTNNHIHSFFVRNFAIQLAVALNKYTVAGNVHELSLAIVTSTDLALSIS